jgi:hypothetical protein
MQSVLENQASKSLLSNNGMAGVQLLTVADVDKVVTSTNMKVGTYTVAAQPVSLARISVTTTVVDTADTQGTVTITGTDISGATQSEQVTPVSGSTVYTTAIFKTVTSVVGAGWVISDGNDTITVGVDYSKAPTGYYFCKLYTVAQAAVTSQTDESGALNVQLASLTNLPALSTIHGKFSAVVVASGEVAAYLQKA